MSFFLGILSKSKIGFVTIWFETTEMTGVKLFFNKVFVSVVKALKATLTVVLSGFVMFWTI